jgi:hypothetical protein
MQLRALRLTDRKETPVKDLVENVKCLFIYISLPPLLLLFGNEIVEADEIL